MQKMICMFVTIFMLISYLNLNSENIDAVSFENYMVSSGTREQRNVDIAVGLDGKVYLVWIEPDTNDGRYHVMFSYTRDGGMSFSNAAEVGCAKSIIKPTIAVDCDNQIYVAISALYDETFPNDDWAVKKVSINKDGSITASYASDNSHGDDDNIEEIDIAAGGTTGNSKIHIVYKTKVGLLDVIKYRSSAAWGTEVTISGGVTGITQGMPRISAWGENVAVVYVVSSSSIYMKVKIGGRNKTEHTVISETRSSEPCIAYMNDDIFIAYRYWDTISSQTYHDIIFKHGRYVDGSWEWDNATIVDDCREAKYVNCPEITAMNNGVVYVTWYDGRYDSKYKSEIYYDFTTDYGKTFGVDVRVNKDYGGYKDQIFPSISSCGYFGPFLAWTDCRTNVYKVYFEDLSNLRTFSMNPVYNINEKTLPQYKINDIITYEGAESERDTWVYDGKNAKWCEKTSIPERRSNHALATINNTDEILMFGGYNISAKDVNGETWSYNYTSTQWTNLTPEGSLRSWTQTDQEEFETGIMDIVDIYSSYGDIMLATSVMDITQDTTWSSNLYRYNTIIVRSGCTLTLNYDGVVYIYAKDIVIESGGTIRADGVSSATTSGAGQGTNNGDGGGGAGYGNVGGNGGKRGGVGLCSNRGSSYDTDPIDVGSKGGDGNSGGSDADALGGKGGGGIYIYAGGEVAVNGVISANGSAGEEGASDADGGDIGGGGGGGSGGGIYIRCYWLTGNGKIYACGGNGGNGGSDISGGNNYPGGGGGGGGSGGRIKISYAMGNAFSGTHSESGGNGGLGGTGSSSGTNGESGSSGSWSSYKQTPLVVYSYYEMSGTFISSPHDCEGAADFDTIYWEETEPTSTSVKIQIRSAKTESGLEYKSFVGPDGTTTSYYSTPQVGGESIWSGHDGDSWFQYKVYLDTTDNTKTPVFHEISIVYTITPRCRSEHALATIYSGSRVLLFGGNDGNGLLGDTWVYDRITNVWTKKEVVSSPSPRMGHAMAGIYGTDKVLLYGGHYYSGGSITYLSDTWIYDASDNTWTQIYDNVPGARSEHALATVDHSEDMESYIVLFGGISNNGFLTETYLFTYDISRNVGSWAWKNCMNPFPRISASMATIYGVLYGGKDQRGDFLDDVWVFDKMTSSWSSVSTGPSARSEHAMACINGTSNIVLFGGNGSYHYIVVGGEGYLSNIKYSGIKRYLVNYQLGSHNGGTNCVINSITIRNGLVIAGGKSSIQAEIWCIELWNDTDSVLESIDRSWLGASSYSDEITEVCYGSGVSATLMSARHQGNNYLLRVDEDLSSANAISHSYSIGAICYNGNGYYVFSYDNNAKTNKVYIQDGSLTGSLSSITVSGSMPKGMINDAITVKIDDDTLFTYLAANAYMPTSTRGLYKVITKNSGSVTYEVSEINVDGDADKPYFNYSAIDANYYGNRVFVLAVGSNCYSTFVGESAKGFVCAFGEEYRDSSWVTSTFYFETTNKKEFCATKMLYENYYQGGMAAIGGLVNSPALFIIGGSIEASINLTASVASVDPIVEDAKITIPGDDPNITNRMNEQFVPTGTNKLEFRVNVTELNDIDTLEEVRFQAWYDDLNGDGVEDTYSYSCGLYDANARVEILCTRISKDNYQFILVYPSDSEVSFDAEECQAIEDGYKVRLKFVYAPSKQSRYSYGGRFRDGESCAGTWNFQFQCKKEGSLRTPVGGASGNSGDGWEFGLQRVTTLVGVVESSVSGEIAPGEYGITNNITIVWSSNNGYKFSVEMKTPLKNGDEEIDCDYVMVHEAYNSTEGYVGRDFKKSDNGLGFDNYTSFDMLFKKVFLYGNEEAYLDAPRIGYEQKFSTNYLVYVPEGTRSGEYTATLAYLLDIAVEPRSLQLPSSVAAWSKVGETESEFGNSLAKGDVNGDGYDDVLIGAYGYSNSKGKVYLYLGSASGLSATESWTKTGENENDCLGSAICVRDVNRDGYDDVLIGAYGYSNSKGKVYLYLGSASGLSTTESWT
ncbi:MAG: kelch repeat-containing protein [Thermoplasmata archaeon]